MSLLKMWIQRGGALSGGAIALVLATAGGVIAAPTDPELLAIAPISDPASSTAVLAAALEASVNGDHLTRDRLVVEPVPSNLALGELSGELPGELVGEPGNAWVANLGSEDSSGSNAVSESATESATESDAVAVQAADSATLATDRDGVAPLAAWRSHPVSTRATDIVTDPTHAPLNLDWNRRHQAQTTPDSAPETAQASPDPNAWPRNWTFSVGPWAFAPLSLSGSTEVNGSDVSVDQDLSDMLTTLDGGLTGDFAAWYRHKVGILFNASYFQVSSDGEAASVSDRQLGRLGLTRLNTDISAEGDATFSQGRFDLMFAYRLMDESQITPSATFTEFDLPPVSLVLMGGARLWTTHVDLDVDVTATGTLSVGNQQVERQVKRGFEENYDDTWVEPVIGGILRFNLSQNLAFVSRATISGFNWNDMSFTVIGGAGLDWLFSGDTSLILGYQLRYQETNRTNNQINVQAHGPYLGVKFRF